MIGADEDHADHRPIILSRLGKGGQRLKFRRILNIWFLKSCRAGLLLMITELSTKLMNRDIWLLQCISVPWQPS